VLGGARTPRCSTPRSTCSRPRSSACSPAPGLEFYVEVAWAARRCAGSPTLEHERRAASREELAQRAGRDRRRSSARRPHGLGRARSATLFRAGGRARSCAGWRCARRPWVAGRAEKPASDARCSRRSYAAGARPAHGRDGRGPAPATTSAWCGLAARGAARGARHPCWCARDQPGAFRRGAQSGRRAWPSPAESIVYHLVAPEPAASSLCLPESIGVARVDRLTTPATPGSRATSFRALGRAGTVVSLAPLVRSLSRALPAPRRDVLEWGAASPSARSGGPAESQRRPGVRRELLRKRRGRRRRAGGDTRSARGTEPRCPVEIPAAAAALRRGSSRRTLGAGCRGSLASLVVDAYDTGYPDRERPRAVAVTPWAWGGDERGALTTRSRWMAGRVGRPV
jgi:hypothetical protein